MSDYIKILKTLCIKKGADIYMVGGAVRDLLLKRDIRDYDFAISNGFSDIARAFSDIIAGSYVSIHEDVIRVVKDGCIFDFCRLKGSTIQEDLLKRDFTINSLAKNLITDDIIDITNGIEDIKNRLIRFVKHDVFDEDPLRMMRAVRLSCELGFKVSEETKRLIIEKHHLLNNSAPERIMDELLKIFSCKYTYTFIDFLDNLKLLYEIFPVMESMRKIGKCRYHVVDAYTHSLLTLQFLEDNIQNVYGTINGPRVREHLQGMIGPYKRFTIVKLGAFLHDIGKPSAMKYENGRVSFKEHDITGEIEFRAIAEKYNMKNDYRKLINDIILGHMRVLVLFKQGISDEGMYKLFRDYGNNTIDVLVSSLFDVIATTILLIENDEPVTYWDFVMKVIDGYYRYLNIPKNLVNGNDIISLKEIDGKKVGDILDNVYIEIFKGNISTREEAIKYIKANDFSNL